LFFGVFSDDLCMFGAFAEMGANPSALWRENADRVPFSSGQGDILATPTVQNQTPGVAVELRPVRKIILLRKVPRDAL
jgi:hypothetical protein